MRKLKPKHHFKKQAAPIKDENWLTPPYYTAPPAVEVDTATASGKPAHTITLESFLQKAVEGSLSDAGGFLNGSKGVATPYDLIDSYVRTARERVATYPSLGENIDVDAMGTQYANMLLDLLHHIPASVADGPARPGSIYDVWTAA